MKSPRGWGLSEKFLARGWGLSEKNRVLPPGNSTLPGGGGGYRKELKGPLCPVQYFGPHTPQEDLGIFPVGKGRELFLIRLFFFWKICALGWRILSRAEIWLEPNPHHCLGVSETKYWWTVNRSISSYWQNASRNIVWSVLEEYYAAYEFLEGPPLRAFVNIPCKHILSSGCLERAFR